MPTPIRRDARSRMLKDRVPHSNIEFCFAQLVAYYQGLLQHCLSSTSALF